jgi:hypothetical protein
MSLQVIVCILRLLAPPSRKVGTRMAGNLAATLPPVSLRLLMYLTRSTPGLPEGCARKTFGALAGSCLTAARGIWPVTVQVR